MKQARVQEPEQEGVAKCKTHVERTEGQKPRSQRRPQRPHVEEEGDDAVAQSQFPENKFQPATFPPPSGPCIPPLLSLLALPLPARLHTTHLPSVLPHSRVRILGRCWVSTVSQLNKTIWKQSGPVNAPAQSEPSPFVAAEKTGLSESRGWRAGRGRHTISIRRLSLYPPTQARFYHRLLSTPHTPTLLSAPFKGEHAIWNRAVCVTVPPRTRYSPSSPLTFLLSHFHLLYSPLTSDFKQCHFFCNNPRAMNKKKPWLRIRQYRLWGIFNSRHCISVSPFNNP